MTELCLVFLRAVPLTLLLQQTVVLMEGGKDRPLEEDPKLHDDEGPYEVEDPPCQMGTPTVVTSRSTIEGQGEGTV